MFALAAFITMPFVILLRELAVTMPRNYTIGTQNAIGMIAALIPLNNAPARRHYLSAMITPSRLADIKAKPPIKPLKILMFFRHDIVRNEIFIPSAQSVMPQSYAKLHVIPFLFTNVKFGVS